MIIIFINNNNNSSSNNSYNDDNKNAVEGEVEGAIEGAERPLSLSETANEISPFSGCSLIQKTNNQQNNKILHPPPLFIRKVNL